MYDRDQGHPISALPSSSPTLLFTFCSLEIPNEQKPPQLGVKLPGACANLSRFSALWEDEIIEHWLIVAQWEHNRGGWVYTWRTRRC